MTEQQFETITKWQRETFGNATALSKVEHLKQEVNELVTELKLDEVIGEDKHKKRLEFADCFLLLFGAAASDGMSYEDCRKAIDEKMEINYKRKWGKPDANGVVNHIKE